MTDDNLHERINIRGEIESIQATIHEREKAVNQRFLDQERAVQAALQAAKEAVTKAEVAQERRLDLLNEFRAQAADESSKYVTKDQYHNAHESIEKDIKRIDSFVNKVLGVALAVPVFLTVISLVLVFATR